jgi:hypothetical protein
MLSEFVINVHAVSETIHTNFHFENIVQKSNIILKSKMNFSLIL